MDVSVIIPIYNVAAWIEDCIRSVCQQTFGGSYEIILVDDCTTDNSVALAEQTIVNYPLSIINYKLLHHDRNRGLSAARNTGLEAARGEYVLFVDSDDQLKPRCLELLYEQAQKMQADMTYGGFETFGEREHTHHPHEKPYVMAWNKLCRRSFLLDNNIRFIEGLIHEDCPWSFEVECKTRHIAVVKDITYRYLIRKGGLQTAGDYERHFSAYCSILKSYAATIEESIRQHRRSPEQLAKWFETQKALYFTMTLDHGTSGQAHKLYSLIRTLEPKEPFGKATAHYRMPEWVGYFWYRKFHKYHLC